MNELSIEDFSEVAELAESLKALIPSEDSPEHMTAVGEVEDAFIQRLQDLLGTQSYRIEDIEEEFGEDIANSTIEILDELLSILTPQ